MEGGVDERAAMGRNSGDTKSWPWVRPTRTPGQRIYDGPRYRVPGAGYPGWGFHEGGRTEAGECDDRRGRAPLHGIQGLSGNVRPRGGPAPGEREAVPHPDRSPPAPPNPPGRRG